MELKCDWWEKMQHNRCSDNHQNVSPCDTNANWCIFKTSVNPEGFLSLRPADATMAQHICEVDSWTPYSKQWRYRSFWTSVRYSCAPADLKKEKLELWVIAALTFVKSLICNVTVSCFNVKFWLGTSEFPQPDVKFAGYMSQDRCCVCL